VTAQIPLVAAKDRPPGWTAKDAKYTPRALADVCVRLLSWSGVYRVVEPHAGSGVFVDAVRAHVRHHVSVDGFDIDPNCPAVSSGKAALADVLDMSSSSSTVAGGYDRAIGNCPYSKLTAPPHSRIVQHTAHCLTLARDVAFVLPIRILAGTESVSGWIARAPLAEVWPFIERPWPENERGVGLFLFRNGHTGPMRVHPPMSWKVTP